jgi:hypothetical protein
MAIPKKTKPIQDSLQFAKDESYELFKIYQDVRRQWGKYPHMEHLVNIAREEWQASVQTIRMIENAMSKPNRYCRNDKKE